jgi:hypothetical protein
VTASRLPLFEEEVPQLDVIRLVQVVEAALSIYTWALVNSRMPQGRHGSHAKFCSS